MDFKKGKYNVIFLLMFILFMGVFGFELFSATATPELSLPSVPGIDSEEGGGDETGSGGENEDSNMTQDQSSKNDEVDKNMPTSTRFPSNIVTFALNKLYTGAGYKSTYSKTMTNTANVFGGIKVVQNINGSIDKSGDKSFEKLEFKATGSQANMAVNLIRAFYFDGDNVTKYQTESYNYDFATAAKTEMTRQEYFSNFVLNLAEAPIFSFQNNFNFLVQTKKNASGVEYYTIEAILQDPTLLNSSGYAKYYETSGDLKNVKAQSAKFTFKCYKKSGNMISITGEETYTGTNPAFGVSVDVSVKYTQKFTSTGVQFDIPKP